MNARVNLATAQRVRKDPLASFLGSENTVQASTPRSSGKKLHLAQDCLDKIG
jgi:hypothetical protein